MQGCTYLLIFSLCKDSDQPACAPSLVLPVLVITSGGARVLAARGKRLCCRCQPPNQLSSYYSYGYNNGISVDCEQYAKLGV